MKHSAVLPLSTLMVLLAGIGGKEALAQSAPNSGPPVVEIPIDMSKIEGGAPPPPPTRAAPPPPPTRETAAAPPPPARTQPQKQAAAALPSEVPGVLTRRGALVIEPSLEYAHSDINRFVVGGVSIIDTVLVGAIEATQGNRDATTATLAFRYGVTNRLEAEVRIPYMFRDDRTVNSVISTNNINETTSLSDSGLGDIEAALHYQLNEPTATLPVFVANVRVKSTTGTGPFDLARDNFGRERELATGSGSWGIEPSLTVIAPSDPAVFYASLGYLWNMKQDVNSPFSNNRFVKSVDPGDAIRLSVGMGFALNEKVSISVGYQHDFISESDTTFSDGSFHSQSLSVGSLNIGANWQITNSTALGVGVSVGVTNDSPDVRLMARVPITLQMF